MNLSIKGGKIIKKTLFGEKEIPANDISKVEVGKSGTTITLKNGKTISSKTRLAMLFEDAKYFLENNIAYDDKYEDERTYSDSEIKHMLDEVLLRAKAIATPKIKERLDNSYDIDISIVGEPYYSMMVFKLVKDGVVLTEHKSYEEIGELGVDKAIDEIDLSFLSKWDSNLARGEYIVTVEVLDEILLDRYINNYIIEGKF